MKPRTGAIAVALVCFVSTFLLTRVIWPDLEGGPQPSTLQLPLFIILRFFWVAARRVSPAPRETREACPGLAHAAA